MRPVLAQHVISIWEQGQDIGSKKNLRSYERWRKAEAVKMQAAMQGFKELFDGSNPVKKLVRGIGLSAVSYLPGPKTK